MTVVLVSTAFRTKGSAGFNGDDERWLGFLFVARGQAVYVRNPDYVPRDEPPSGSTGGKKAYLDKVIWRFMADPWDAANDLAAGEVDWWEEPPLEFIPKIEQSPDLKTFLVDPLGEQMTDCPPFSRCRAILWTWRPHARHGAPEGGSTAVRSLFGPIPERPRGHGVEQHCEALTASSTGDRAAAPMVGSGSFNDFRS